MSNDITPHRAATADGSRVIIWTRGGQPDQRWSGPAPSDGGAALGLR